MEIDYRAWYRTEGTESCALPGFAQVLERAQVWDLNKPAPAEVGRDYHLVVASNVLHTAANMASARPRPRLPACSTSVPLRDAMWARLTAQSPGWQGLLRAAAPRPRALASTSAY